MSRKKKETQKERYARTWGTPIGQDCISLNASLAKWLGPRLVFLADHTTSLAPGNYATEEEHEAVTKKFLGDMRAHGEALIAFAETEVGDEPAENALRWVAENFIHLWD